MFNDSNTIKSDSPLLIPDIRNILDVFPQSLRENLVNKISEAIDYEPVIGVTGKTGAGKSSVCNALFQGEVKCVQSVTLKPVRVRPRNCAYVLVNVR